MDKYYYFVSQLPSLQFNQKAQIDRAAFLEEAEKWLTESEFKVISQIDIDDFFETNAEPLVLAEYKSFEKVLRSEIALWRKAKKENKSYQPKAEIGKFVSNLAISGQSPLEAEINLLKFRWRFIQERVPEHNFDLASLILYFLKLQILERMFSFDKVKGTTRFDQLAEVKL